VILAFDVPAGSDKVPKYCQLDAAEALAAHCRRTDRAVILDEQKATIRVRFEPRHVTFG